MPPLILRYASVMPPLLVRTKLGEGLGLILWKRAKSGGTPSLVRNYIGTTWEPYRKMMEEALRH